MARRSTGLKGVTKKDFIAMADILCHTKASARTVNELSSYFKSQNPRFDTGRFKTAAKSCRR